MIQPLTDSGWKIKSDNPRKGITDYERRIAFAYDLSDTEFFLWAQELEKTQPGNFPITFKKINFGVYKAISVFDSSD